MVLVKRIIAWLSVAALCCGLLSACDEADTPTDGSEEVLTIGYTAIGGVFSPFYAALESDRAVVDLTQLYLLSTDREGQVVLDGINGETREYNGTAYTYTGPASVTVITNDDGTVYYDFTLRQDIVFSDGTPVTADDVLFTMYVLCDPTYDGPLNFASLPIEGLEAYRAGMTPKWQLILKDTPTTAATGSPDGYYTAAEAMAFWEVFNTAGTDFVSEIVQDATPEDEELPVSAVAESMGYAGLSETATASDFFHAIVDRRGYDVSEKGIDAERRSTSFAELLKSRLPSSLLCGVPLESSAEEITGIVKTGDNTLRVTLTEYNATALQLMCIPIAPKHYYTNADLSEDEQTLYGFVKGDLTAVRDNTSTILGGGPYCFIKYTDGIVQFHANPLYYLGKPIFKRLTLRRTSETEAADRIDTDKVHIMAVPYSKAGMYAVEKVNGGVQSGDSIAVKQMSATAYHYIGISASAVKVGNDSGSQASRYLRKALAMVFAYYRALAIEEYYATSATVLQTWLPSTDVDAPDFLTDSEGQSIFTGNETTAEEKRDAVLKAVLSYLSLAGYTVEDGKVTAAPAGASLSYRFCYDGDGTNTYPAYKIASWVRNALALIGITLTVDDVSSANNLYQRIETERAAIWYHEISVSSQSDLYSRYFSGKDGQPAGSLSYQLDLQDSRLDALLLDMVREPDAEQRAVLYEQCMQQVGSWVTEIPVCQTNTILLYRVGSIDMSTFTPDVTPYYGWMREIHKLSTWEITE